MLRSLLLVLFITSCICAPGQDVPREVWDTGFLQKRPARPAGAGSARSQDGVRYKVAGESSQEMAAHGEAAVGVTVWRLRPAAPRDDSHARLLIQDGPGAAANEMVPERMDPKAALHVGDRIRLSIEVPRDGFLYVIDRERYRDGSTGDPYLIFPTLNQDEGRNEVAPGRVIEIPSRTSRFKALLITRSSEKQIGEDLIFVVSSRKLENVMPTEAQQKLSSDVMAALQKEWSSPSVRFDLASPAQAAWTDAEQKAGSSTRAFLDRGDPPPSSILNVAPGSDRQPVLVHFALSVE